MRILVIAPFGPGLLAQSYAGALEQNGHEVVSFDSDRAYFGGAWYARNRVARRLMRDRLWGRMNRHTLGLVGDLRPDLVLAFKTPYLDPETVIGIRDGLRTPIANYYPDHPYCGVPLDPRKTSAQRRDIIECLRQYTRVFMWDKHLVARLRADGVSSDYLPFGVDAEAYHPMAPVPCRECGARHAAVFVGQHNVRRQRHVGAIGNHQVALWGARWNRAQGQFNGRHLLHKQAVFGPECAAVYAGAAVVLNIVNAHNMPGHNMRTFEIPASGGVMLATYTAEQAEFFPEGEAAWYYRDPAEIDAILDRLFNDPAALERTRCAALELAKQHDYQSRAKQLVAGLSGQGP